MSDIHAKAQITLTVNGKQAADMLAKLKTQAQDLEKGIAKAAAAGDKTKLTKLQRELKATNRQIQQIESATVGVEEVMKRLDRSSPKELNRTLTTLRKQLDGIERGSEAWEIHTSKIRAVRSELDKVYSELREGEGFWDRFNRKMNDWQTTLAAAAASVTGLVMAGRSAVKAYADVDGAMANVRKYTRMTVAQVEDLNEEFSKMDTRTSRIDLNKLAEDAGRLGKTTKEDVLGYVRAADQINVALEDLGAGATLTVSKLTNIFGDEKIYGTEQSLIKVGSVINELSENCTASAPYLANFAKRMAGVGAQAKMTIPEIMGFAAVLDSQGQAVEMSATALSKLIMDMFKQQDKVINATGLNAEKFNEALKRSTNEGLLMLIERLHELGDIDVLAPVFKDMGENGARAAQVISALAANLDMVKWEQEEAKKAFEEGISVTREFNVQNNTVQAGLDKARKHVTELAVELGEKLMPMMRHVITSTTLMLKFLSTVVDFIKDYRVAIVSATAAFVAYKVAVNLSTIAFKAHYAWLVITETATKAYRAAVVLLTAAHTAYRMAMAKLTNHYVRQQSLLYYMNKQAAALKTVYNLLAAAVVGLTVALITYIRNQDMAAKIAKMMTGIRTEAAKKVSEEKVKIDLLVAAAKNEKLSLDERHTAINKLNKIVPKYNGHLDDTTGKYTENKQALDDYISSLTKMYEVMGAKDKLVELGKQKAEAVLEKKAAEKTLKEIDKSAGSGVTYTTSYGSVGNTASDSRAHFEGELDKANRKIRQVEQSEKAITDAYGASLQASEAKEPVPEMPDKPDTGSGGGTTDDTTDDGKGGSDKTSSKSEDKFKAEKEWREREEAYNRIAYARGEKNFEDYSRRMNDIAVDYNNKRLAHTDLTEQERITIEAEAAEAEKKLRDDNAKMTIDAENKSYEEVLAILRQRYIDGELDTKTYEEAVEISELQHLKRLVALYEEGSSERRDAQKSYDDKVIADQKKRQKEAEDVEKKHQEFLKELKDEYFGPNQAENDAEYMRQLAALTDVYEAEVKATADNAKEKLRIEEAFEEAKRALRKKYRQDDEEDGKNSLEEWNEGMKEWLESDFGQAVMESFDTISDGMSNIFTQMTSLIQAETQIQTAAIEKRYDAEISKAEGNKYKVNKLEKQKEAETAKVKKEANRKQFAMQVIQAVAQTATAALNAYSSAAAVPYVGYILAPIAAAMAVAAGMLQVAAIKKQQQASEAQGYATGGFTPKGGKYEEVGVVHAGEWVASQELLASPVARPMIEALDYAQRTNTIGSLKSEDVSAAISPTYAAAQSSQQPIIVSPSTDTVATAAVVANTKAMASYADTMRQLSRRLAEPFITVNTVSGDTGIKQAQDEYDRLIRNKTPKSRRKFS